MVLILDIIVGLPLSPTLLLSTPISSIFKISIFFSLALIVELSEALLRGVAVGVNDIRDGSFNFNI